MIWLFPIPDGIVCSQREKGCFRGKVHVLSDNQGSMLPIASIDKADVKSYLHTICQIFLSCDQMESMSLHLCKQSNVQEAGYCVRIEDNEI